jgi:hypothetical protein
MGEVDEPDVKEVQTEAVDQQESFSDEIPLIKEFQEEQADDPEVTINKLAHSITIDQTDVQEQAEVKPVVSQGPEEDDYL